MPHNLRISLLASAILAQFALIGCSGQSQAENAQTPNRKSPDSSVQKQPAREQSPRPVSETSPPPKVPPETETQSPSLVGILQPADLPARQPSRVYRTSDNRPKYDAKRLAELGIRRFASKHLELYTDIQPERAADLPKLLDQLQADLEKYFGPLPPDREGRVYQLTGYIMADARVFRETGLLPEDLPAFNHGRHRGYEFWMNDQEHDYYLRHLMLHEATHCYMTILRNPYLLPPVWYMEGMAEHFGTHLISKDGSATFRVMPDDKEAFAGLGRITLIQTAIKEGRFKTLDQVFEQTANDYGKNEAYAWSWAMCKFLDTHPRYRKDFQDLGNVPTHAQFIKRFLEAYQADLDEMRTEWALFAHNLDDGYEIEPAAISFRGGLPLTSAAPETVVTLKADRGWQSSGVLLEPGKKYTITATGQFTLAQTPKPWTSEADGISFRYFGGEPLGKLLGAIRTDTPDSITSAHSLRQVFPIGSIHTSIATQTGTLYLRLNDDWSQVRDNNGEVTVRIRLE